MEESSAVGKAEGRDIGNAEGIKVGVDVGSRVENTVNEYEGVDVGRLEG